MKKALSAVAVGVALAASSAANAGWLNWVKFVNQLTEPTVQENYTKTAHPIVLVHGAMGFKSIEGVEYFYGIAQSLRRSGATVFTANLSALESDEARGEQLIEQLENWQAINGATGFNLMGHAQGGNTIRYVAAVRPDLVKSVTAIGTPINGSIFADKVLDVFKKLDEKQPLLGKVTKFVGQLITNGAITLVDNAVADNPSGKGQNIANMLTALSTENMQSFNEKYSAALPIAPCGEGEAVVNGVHYYSWGGNKSYTNPVDPSDYIMLGTALMFGKHGDANTPKHDGLVSSCNMHLGKVIRDDYKLNHLDEINQVMGMYGFFNTNPISIYRQHANRLQQAGL
ncbi:triacylglycerol lipase [Zooshikella marina]|uniref:Triacylglycerol lipase n=1 Tax=Zooshikella ganghwensis TaxID=202772 RepID=A0A4P9VGS0_9GAMM|nr:triacylglycerol lipase [Zooshikella ganghwensis]MBU2706550.1 triacylglycerol lipase [Zooshikella ganghwensis]RDH42355.1 triacylglycerol lipase [Zooshikella ganghwensis]